MQTKNLKYTNILLPTFFYFSSYFMILSIDYQILINEVCIQINSDNCNSSDVSSKTSYLMTFISLIGSIPCILLSGVYSSIADKYGRKNVIIMPIIGLFIKIFILLYVNILHPTYFFLLYLFSSFITGILGSQVIFNMGIFTYVADTYVADTYVADTYGSNILNRSNAYSIVELCIIVPKIVGFLLSGLLSKYYGFIITLLVILTFNIFSFIFAYIIPESLPKKIDVELKIKNTFYNLKLLLFDSNIVIRLLSFAYFLFYFCLIGSTGLDILYFKHKFQWGSDRIGYYQAIEGAIGVFSILLICKISNIYNKFTLFHWVAIGYFFRIVFWSFIGFSNSVELIYIALPFLVLTGSISPYTRTIISNNMVYEEQTKIFAAFSTLQNFPTVMIPLLDICYSISVTNNLSWVVYQLMSFLVCISLIATLYSINTPEFNIISFKNNNKLLENTNTNTNNNNNNNNNENEEII